MLWTVATIMKQMKNVDFVFCNGLYFETALALRLSLIKVPSLVKIVGDPVWERAQNRGVTRNPIQARIENWLSRVLGRLERKAITWSLLQFDCVTTPGESLAQEVESWSTSLKVQVVHNGVKIPNEESEEVKKYDLVTISRLVPWKNVDIVIAIAAQLGCTLAIIGDGPQRKFLESNALSNPNVTFFGQQNYEQIENILRRSRVFCQLSDYEGLSFSLLQAMAYSLPCVLSDIKANRDVFQSDHQVGLFVASRNIHECSKVIKELLNSPKMQKELGKRSHSIAKSKFDEIKQMETMMKLLINHD
jgi:glycosyltransferase involved in cell wall biosynthesis